MSKSFDNVPKSRALRTAAPIPKTKFRLLGANGQVITPSSPAAAPSPDTSAADAAAAAAAQAEYERQVADYERQMAEYQQQMEEYAQQQAAAESAAAPAPQGDAESPAPEEQPAPTVEQSVPAPAQPEPEPAAAEDIPAAPHVPDIPETMVHEAAAPAPQVARPKLTIAKPTLKPAQAPTSALKPAQAPTSALKPAQAPTSALKPAKAPTSALKRPATNARPRAAAAPAAAAASEAVEGEEENNVYSSAYIESMKAQASIPFWKNKLVIGGFIFMVVVGGWSTYTILDNKAREEQRKAHQDAVNALLVRSSKINRQGVERLADAKKKNVEVSCTPAEAELLLSVVIDPYAKNEFGQQRYGAAPESVAQNASLLLGLAAEKDPAIAKLIFKKLAENASKIKPSLFTWQLDRLVIADVPNINKLLSALADDISAQPKFKKKTEILSSVWEAKGLRVTEKDIPDIAKLLNSKDLDKQLATTLSICLSNILMMIDDADKKQRIGDKIYDAVPEKFREQLIFTFGAARSTKARAHYEKRMENKKNWSTDIRLFANWGDDSVIPYLIELQGKASSEQEKRTVRGALATLFAQNRERNDADVQLLLNGIYDKLEQDCSDWDTVLNKTDPDAAAFIGKDAPEYARLMERRKELEDIRTQKLNLMRALGRLHEYPWVLRLIERFENDGDADVSNGAKKARAQLKENMKKDKEQRDRYKRRTGK